MDSAPMQAFAQGLAGEGFRVVRFEFPYMQRRRDTGKRGGPDRPPVLMEAWRRAVATAGGGRMVIGGKSMGGRIASMIADDVGASPHFSHPPWSARRRPADRAGKPRGAMWGIGQAA